MQNKDVNFWSLLICSGNPQFSEGAQWQAGVFGACLEAPAGPGKIPDSVQSTKLPETTKFWQIRRIYFRIFIHTRIYLFLFLKIYLWKKWEGYACAGSATEWLLLACIHVVFFFFLNSILNAFQYKREMAEFQFNNISKTWRWILL